MNKPTLVFQGPCFTRSGYGEHCRDLLKSLRRMDAYDIKIIPLRWGNTPQNQADESTEFGRWMLGNIAFQLNEKPDIFIQVSVPNEFEPKGHYNIGITAGVETTICPKDFIDGSNRMDLIIVPSNFTKQNIAGTIYQQKDQQTDRILGEYKLVKPVEVLFEGVDVDIYGKYGDRDILSSVTEDFNFLIVGHWLRGVLGEDRKDIGMAIKTFTTVFRYMSREKRPGLIIKTSHAGFSVLDRESIHRKVKSILSQFPKDDIPSVYLIHGELDAIDMASLYHHPKVKAMVSFTKGEGYGRPLAEFTLTGKPIMASNWSGHLDFLPNNNTILLDGKLTHVHESAVDNFIMKEAQWFTVDYSNAANKMYDLYNRYDEYLKKSNGLRQNTLTKFSLDCMHNKFLEILNTYVKKKPQFIPLNIPKLNTNIQIPKLNKI
jgi:hypothetical protein